MGIDTMKAWSPERYSSLDTTHDGMVSRDGLSYDIFSAVGKAINRVGESIPSGKIDILDGLKAEIYYRYRSFAIGESLSYLFK